MLKTCYVRLNRIVPDSLETINVNTLQEIERKNLKHSYGNKNFGGTSSLEISDGKNNKLRKERKVKYLDGSRNSCSETSHSEDESRNSCSETSQSEDESRNSCSETSQSEDESSTKKQRKKTLERKSKHFQKQESKKLNCLECGQSFRSHSSYLIHKRSHLPEPFKCSLCKMGWKYRQSFIYHMKGYHPEVEPFICEYRRCEQSFKTQKLLEIHSKVHLRYMCAFCKKLYAKKYQMRKHVLKNH